MGDSAEARKRLAALEAQRGQRFISDDAFALMYLGLGDTRRALDLLERAADERDFTLVLLPVYPYFAGVHDEPRYRAVLKRLGIPGE